MNDRHKNLLGTSALIGIAFVVCGPHVSMHGQEVARVKNELNTESPVWVGQQVSFFVELMSSTFFSGTPHFDVPEVPGAFIIKDEGRPVMGSEGIEGETWSTQRHHFRDFSTSRWRVHHSRIQCPLRSRPCLWQASPIAEFTDHCNDF